jgi:hypothetical protein
LKQANLANIVDNAYERIEGGGNIERLLGKPQKMPTIDEMMMMMPQQRQPGKVASRK